MALKKWGFASKEEAREFCRNNKKSKLKGRNKK